MQPEAKIVFIFEAHTFDGSTRHVVPKITFLGEDKAYRNFYTGNKGGVGFGLYRMQHTGKFCPKQWHQQKTL